MEFLLERLPYFQRQGGANYKIDLSKTLKFCAYLGNPENVLKFIHIAGTNGKGSTAHMICAALQTAGHRSGLYTSPHLVDFRERFTINGEFAPKSFVSNFLNRHLDFIETEKPSFFELGFGMALSYFREQKTDIVILETGMGGRLDSTNVVSPLLSVITNIGMDHSEFLGDSIEKIAGEKGGIIKQGIPIVLGEMRENARSVLRQIAVEKNSPVLSASQLPEDIINRPEYEDFPPYIQENMSTAYCALSYLQRENWLSKKELIDGLINFQKINPIRGRWQQIADNPRVFLDVAHNQDGLRQLIKQLATLNYRKLHWIYGMVNDKDPELLNLLPKEASYYLCEPNIPRKMELNVLEEHFNKRELSSQRFDSPIHALRVAIDRADKDDLVLVSGSLFVVAEILRDTNFGADEN